MSASTSSDIEQSKTMSISSSSVTGSNVGTSSGLMSGAIGHAQGTPVSVVPVPHTNPLVGIALPQTILSPRLVTSMIPTVSPVTLAAPTIPSISTQGSSTTQGQGHGQGSAGSAPATLVMGIPPKSQVNADGEVILDVECGPNKAKIYLSKLCQGSKGPCVLYNQAWLTPNEFQYVSGRETAKDWKRSIRHHGKSMKLLMAKGVMALNPPSCRCEACTGIDPFANNNLPLQESLTVNTSASGLKTIPQHPGAVNSPPKVKVNTSSKKKPEKKPMSGNMAETAGAAGGIKAVQADVNANTLAPVTSSSGTPNDCYEFRDSPVQPVCALPPILHPIPRGIPAIGIAENAKTGESEKENTQSSSTSTPPGGPTLIAFPVMQMSTQVPPASQPAFPSPTPESKDGTPDSKAESLPLSPGGTKKTEGTSPEVKIPNTSVYLSPGKVGQVDSRDSKENQSKVFAPITWPPVMLGTPQPQGQPARSHKTSPKSSPPSSSRVSSSSPSTPAAHTPSKPPAAAASSATSTAPESSSLAKPMPTVVGMPTPSGIPTAVPGVPPVTISAAAVPAGYHEYMATMMARYNMVTQSARMDEANYMTMVRKYYADWYEMYSRYPYAALSGGAAYPAAAAESMKAAMPGMVPFPGYMYPMATADPRLIDLSNRAAATAAAAAKEAESKQLSPSGVKRSLSETTSSGTAGHDVLDLSVKKPKVESPVASRPAAVIPSHPNPLTHSIPGLVPHVGIPGHPGVGIPMTSAGLTIPMAGLPAPTLQSLAAAGYPAGMLDPRALALATGNGTSATLSLAHAQQQALTLSSVGYPMATAYMPAGMPYPQLCSTSSTDRDKLLKAQHMQFAGDIRM